MTIPRPSMIAIIDEPPYETRGNGNPTTGRIPITIDILINAAKKKLEITP